jgi:DNA end-binding protein Ku
MIRIERPASSPNSFDLAVFRFPADSGAAKARSNFAPYEVRDEKNYFDEIPDTKLGKDAMELARHIVETKSGHFHPEKFEDHYEKALRELIAKKQAGERIEAPKAHAPAKVINLMDALKRSIAAEGGTEKKPPAPSRKRREKKPASRSAKVTRKAG